MSAVNALGATVTTILTTHKHWDHASGNTAMGKLLPDVPVLGGAIDKVRERDMDESNKEMMTKH